MTESRAAMAAKGMSRARVWLECIRATVLAIPPTLVVLLLMWSYYVFNYIYVRQYLVNPLEQAMYLSVYHAVLLVFCTTYYRAVTTKPSGPPPQFGLSEQELDDLIEGSSPSDMVAKRRLPIRTLAYNGLLRFCFTCKALKPDRCHHCSVCRRCVLKMDHHCPWVGNCVGWHNYKFFILFLFWGIVYLLMFMYAIFPVVHKFIASDSHRNARSPGQGPILLSFLLAISFSLSMFILLLFHLVLIASNRTTLEGFSSLKFVRPSSRGWRLPGILANFEEVFGPLSYKWLLPVGKGSSGTGWDFSVVHDQGISHV